MKGVDREFATMFNIFDESRNWYVEENIRNYLTDKNPPPLDQLLRNFDFWESSYKHTINGYHYGNVPGLTMYKGEKVVWYLLQVGGRTQKHPVHFHGQTILYVRNV